MMTKKNIADYVAENAGITKAQAGKAVDAVLAAIETALKEGDKVQIASFGTFKVRDVAARKGHNPRTGETIEIAASKTVSFTAGKGLKDSVQ